MSESVILRVLKELVFYAVTRVPRDVYEALKRAYVNETERLAREHLAAIIRSIEVAVKEETPLCQDTGLPFFYFKVGSKFPIKTSLEQLATQAVRECVRDGILRPNSVHPFTNVNSGDCTGSYIPWVEYEITEGDILEVTFLAKGGGSEAPSTLKMLLPIEGLRGVKREVLKAILDAGGKPCPPTIVGVGIAGTADIATQLAKKALLRNMNKRHPESEVAKLELELLHLANKLGIGPMGMGGKTTVLDVRVEYSHRHPATLAMAVIFNCWALRKATAKIYSNGQVEYNTNEVWTL